jgi:hypothetical protein
VPRPASLTGSRTLRTDCYGKSICATKGDDMAQRSASFTSSKRRSNDPNKRSDQPRGWPHWNILFLTKNEYCAQIRSNDGGRRRWRKFAFDGSRLWLSLEPSGS